MSSVARAIDDKGRVGVNLEMGLKDLVIVVDIGLVEVSRDLALVIVRFVETWRKAGVRSVSTCRDLT